MGRVGVKGVKSQKDEPNGNIAVNENEVPKVVKIAIPAELYSEYVDLAAKQGLTLNELIIHRLRHCKDHNSIRPIYFSDAHRQQLEQAVGKRPLDTADQAVSAILAVFRFRVDGFEPIQLSSNQARRLQMAAYGGLTVEDRLRQIVTSAVSKSVGL